MQFHPLFLFTSVIICLISGCSKGSDKEHFYEDVAGIWVPYQLISRQGDTALGFETFSGASIFGTYRESIQFEKDQYYIAVNWTDSASLPAVRTGSSEEGYYTYSPESNMLITEGQNAHLWQVLRFKEDELILSDGNTVFLRRKRKW